MGMKRNPPKRACFSPPNAITAGQAPVPAPSQGGVDFQGGRRGLPVPFATSGPAGDFWTGTRPRNTSFHQTMSRTTRRGTMPMLIPTRSAILRQPGKPGIVCFAALATLHPCVTSFQPYLDETPSFGLNLTIRLVNYGDPTAGRNFSAPSGTGSGHPRHDPRGC